MYLEEQEGFFMLAVYFVSPYLVLSENVTKPQN